MKKNQSKDESPLHQTVAEQIEFECGGKSIAVGFTEQKLSAHAGSATFWGWLHSTDWKRMLQVQLPHRQPTSNNHLTPVEKALAYLLEAARQARDSLSAAVPEHPRVRARFAVHRSRTRASMARCRASPGERLPLVLRNVAEGSEAVDPHHATVRRLGRGDGGFPAVGVRRARAR